mgnify:FL=1
MYSIDDLLTDEHLRAIGLLRMHEHPTEGRLVSIGVPTEWSETRPDPGLAAPNLGEHTLEILQSLGYAAERIEALLASGAAMAANTRTAG